MIKRLASVVFALCRLLTPAVAISLWLAVTPAWAGSMLLLGAGGAATAPILDGSAVSAQGSTNTNTLTLTTTKTNDEIIVFVAVNSCNGGDVVAVTSAHLTFTIYANSTFPGANTGCAGTTLLSFSAPASSVLTAEVLTVTIMPGISISYTEVMAFGVNGINTGSPFDSNAGLPSQVAAGVVSITTSHASDFIFAGFRATGTDAGWTNIVTGNFVSCEYKRVTSTQSGLAAGGSNGNNGGIGDAIVSP